MLLQRVQDSTGCLNQRRRCECNLVLICNHSTEFSVTALPSLKIVDKYYFNFKRKNNTDTKNALKKGEHKMSDREKILPKWNISPYSLFSHLKEIGKRFKQHYFVKAFLSKRETDLSSIPCIQLFLFISATSDLYIVFLLLSCYITNKHRGKLSFPLSCIIRVF